ncbi:MAG TPA: hypothetical protein PK393_08990 [Synergistaceae bacterium]|jgi:hypothetical protein|nr:hypothetical protein [Synergistaceae bacterium]
METYLVRVAIALALLALGGWALASWAPSRRQGKGLELLAVLPLGRDLVRVVGCGPEVVALLSSRGGTTVIGRWSREEWQVSCGRRDMDA